MLFYWEKCLAIMGFLVFNSSIEASTFRNHTDLLVVSSRDSSGWSSTGASYGSGSVGSHSFFDIALTALAFMSFGIFLLNLLMNALFLGFGTQGLTSTGPVITTGIETATGGGTGTTDPPPAPAALIYIRKKRATYEFIVDRPSSANSLAATVLNSIDAMVEKHECLPKIFCDGSRQAQVVGHGFQYILPLYSFVESLIGEKLGLHKNLEGHLDAILYGITESNCKSQFPQCSR